jgi:DNA-binding SARP family transcriptional activator
LLLRANHTADAQWLMEVVWPDGQPASAQANLRQYVAKVREVLRHSSLDGVASLRSAPNGYRLEVGRDEVDLTVFDRLTALGRAALDSRDMRAAREYLAEAVSLWRGELGEGVPPGPELEAERAYWQELRMLATQSLLAARLSLGEHGEVTAELRRLIAEHPLREELCGMLMVSLYRGHRRGDALEAFRQARALLVTDLGMEPGNFLQRIQRAILVDDPALLSGAIPGLVRPDDGTVGPVGSARRQARHPRADCPPSRSVRHRRGVTSRRLHWPP